MGCEDLVRNSDRALGFRCFAEIFSNECRERLKDDFQIFQLQPTWVISAQFTDGGQKRLNRQERLAIFIALHREMERHPPEFGVSRATGLLPPYLFGSLSEGEFGQFLTQAEAHLPQGVLSDFRGKSLKLVTMELWSTWSSFRWLSESLRRLGFVVEIKVLSRSDYFGALGSRNMEEEYDLNFIPTGVGDPDPDGTWQTASKNFFPGSIDHSRVRDAFLEVDRKKRQSMYKELARELLSKGVFMPLRLDAPYIGVHKSLKMGDVAPFRAGLTLYDFVPANP
jgi:hypothetical protein